MIFVKLLNYKKYFSACKTRNLISHVPNEHNLMKSTNEHRFGSIYKQLSTTMLTNSLHCKVLIFVAFELCPRALFFKFLIANLILSILYHFYLCEDSRSRSYLLELFLDNTE